jgi:phosphoenolpyruvate synthase/pyruvate phosphate dikinase
MSNTLTLDASDDIRVVGQLGSLLAKTKRAGLRTARGFIVPIDKHVGYGLSNEILREFDKLEIQKVILRASPVSSDATETIAPVSRDKLVETIMYMQANAERRWTPSAIVVQEFLDGELRGMIHSQNPYTDARDEVVIEADLWANNSVLGNEDESEMILVDKRDGTVALESDEDELILEADQVQQLWHAVRKAEKAIGAPVSLDWAFVNGVLYILRTRPLSA